MILRFARYIRTFWSPVVARSYTVDEYRHAERVTRHKNEGDSLRSLCILIVISLNEFACYVSS